MTEKLQPQSFGRSRAQRATILQRPMVPCLQEAPSGKEWLPYVPQQKPSGYRHREIVPVLQQLAGRLVARHIVWDTSREEGEDLGPKAERSPERSDRARSFICAACNAVGQSSLRPRSGSHRRVWSHAVRPRRSPLTPRPHCRQANLGHKLSRETTFETHARLDA